MARETSVETTRYLWDDQNLLQEYETLVDVQYTYNPNTYGKLISQRRDGETSYHVFNGEASAMQLTDDTELITDDCAYGDVEATSGKT